MELLYTAVSACSFVLLAWCCFVWRRRAARIRFLLPSLYLAIGSILLCAGLRPLIGPVPYAWLFLILAVLVNLSLTLVMAGIWAELGPPIWISAASTIIALTAVVLLWQNAWPYTRIMLSVLAPAMALSLSCALGGFSRNRRRRLDRSREFLVTSLSIYFGVQFASASGLIGALPFKQVADILIALVGTLRWSLVVWALRTEPVPASLLPSPEEGIPGTDMLWRQS